MKKTIAVFLAIILVFSISTLVRADFSGSMESYVEDVLSQIGYNSSLRSESPIESSAYLYNFNNEPVAILYNIAPMGYAIYDFSTGIVLEYSNDADHPFYTEITRRYYYNGVFQYYKRTAEGFENLATGHVIKAEGAREEIDDFYNEEFYSAERTQVTSRATESGELQYSTRLYNCNIPANYSYFYPDFSASELEDVGGVCGPVACAILVAYYDDYYPHLAGNYGDFADHTNKNSGSSSSYTYGIDLVKEFIEPIDPAGNGSVMLDVGMREYLSCHLLGGSVRMRFYNGYNEMKTAVASGIPLIIGTTNHYCVGIGYTNANGQNQIKVNTGWGRTSVINAYTVISSWELYLD